MSALFNKKDVLTGITVDQAVKGDKGYFGGSLRTITYNVEQDNVHRLCNINEDETSCFTDEEGLDYLFFLPADKVKKSYRPKVKKLYRPIANLEELLEFLVPDLDANAVCDSAGNDDEIIRYKKAELLLGKKITIREKDGAYTNVLIIDRVDFYGDSDSGADIYINNNPLNFMFEAYKILIDGKWVPFGIMEK